MRPSILNFVAIFVLICVSILFPTPSGAVSTTIVISEFRTRGPSGGNDEFIELYNLSGSPVNISGWEIRGSNSSGTVTTRAVITAGNVLNPGCRFLLTNSNTNGYSGSMPGNQTYGVGITDDGGIAVVNNAGQIVDQVGMSNGSVFKEGEPLDPVTSNSNRSYERRPGGAAGSDQDTDDNSSDFQSRSQSDPQNAGASCTTGGDPNPTPTNPTGIGNANPSSINPADNTLLTVNVSPGQNPTSTGINVTGNLAPIGGSASQPFFDNGTNGDVTAGDRVFSFFANVGAGTAQGAKTLSVTITDAQSRSGTAMIGITVGQAVQCGVERWSVKTGTDPDANLVDLNTVVPTTIQIMHSWTAPNPIPPNSRVAPHERTVYAIIGTLTDYKLEDDTDYHLVIQDGANRTVITEIACPCCVGMTSPFRQMIAEARGDFDTRFIATRDFKTANVPVLIKGVGFFDTIHGQRGVAPNGIEIHPILSIDFLQNLTRPVIAHASIVGKHLIVGGFNFGPKAQILLNGVQQKTKADPGNPTFQLLGKKVGKKIAKDQTVILRVRTTDNIESEDFSFKRPQ